MLQSDTEAKSAIFKLAFFEPNIKDNYGNQVLDYLVLEAISTFGTMITCNQKEVKNVISKLFIIDFHEEEIYNAAKRLKKKNLVVIEESDERSTLPRFKLLDSSSDLEEKIEGLKSLEAKVYEMWENELLENYKVVLNKNNVDKLVNSLKTFLTKLVVRHGMESVSLLYPEKDKSEEWFEAIQKDIIKDLPKLGADLELVQQIEIPKFFKSKNDDRIQFVNSLFNSSFIWHLLQVDDKCSKYFKKITEGQVLVLDNNILYSLIGFHGQNSFESTHNLLKYANQLNYKIKVTTRTIDEFYDSVKRNSEKLSSFKYYTKEIAEVAINTLDNSSFMVSYWKEFLNDGLSIEEFVAEKSNIKNILSGLKIEITDRFKDEIENSQELLDEESILRNSCGNHLPPLVVQHDAFHRLFIKKSRGTYKYKFSEAVAWFLTHDSKLATYGVASLKGSKALNFSITTNEWIQINRPFIKRTIDENEFESSFYNLVTQPFLRSALSSFKVDEVRKKLLSRLTKYKNMGTQLSFELVTDVQFLQSITNLEDEKIDSKIEKKVFELNKDLKLENSELYTNIESQNEEIEENNKFWSETIETIKKDVLESSKRNEELENKIKESNLELEKLKRKNENLEVNINKKIKNQNKSSSELVKTKSLLNWTLFIFLFLGLSFFLWTFQYLLTWDWIESHSNKILIKISINFILLFGLLNIPLKKHWFRWLPIVCAFITSILILAKF